MKLPSKQRLGPIAGFALLLAVAVLGGLSSPPLMQPKADASDEEGRIAQKPKHKDPGPVLLVWNWAKDNRDAIEPLTAIGALFAAGALAYVTYLLWGATRALAVSTEDLAQGAARQVAEMALARKLSEQQIIKMGEHVEEAKRTAIAGGRTAVAMADAATAMGRLARTTKETAETQLRAYVYPVIHLRDFTLTGTTKFTAILRNAGITPAVGIQCYGVAFFGHLPLADGSRIPDPRGMAASKVKVTFTLGVSLRLPWTLLSSTNGAPRR